MHPFLLFKVCARKPGTLKLIASAEYVLPQERMHFSQFLNYIQKGNDDYYMSTQEAAVHKSNKCLELHAPPVSLLRSDFPLQPELTNQLVPHQINMWLGTTSMHVHASELSGGSPVRSYVCQNLSNVSATAGHSKQGSSSGLHHDFHDNLYILLNGKKHFQLLSPQHAKQLQMHGNLSCIHGNGRIVYKEEEDLAEVPSPLFETKYSRDKK